MNQFDHGYALLIGVNDCKVKKWALEGVLKDIQEVENVLKDPERCAYLEDNIKKMTGSNATSEGILKGLEWLKGRVEADATENSTVIIYYSGHGWRDASSGTTVFYLIPYNVEEQQVSSSALKADEFADAVASLKPRRLLVLLDCCHAGGMEVKDLGDLPDGYTAAAISPSQFMGGEKSAWKPGEENPNALAKGNGRAVLSSSTGMQKSYMCRDNEMSIFTYHLIEALTGHARPQEGATEVLVSDVMSYVWRRVPVTVKNEWGREQMPDYNVNGNFPIALLLGGEGISLENKTEDILEAGMESLELKDYIIAFKNFQKAFELNQGNEKAQVLYCVSFLAGKTLLSIDKTDMHKIVKILMKTLEGKDQDSADLARVVLGIIRIDYYLKRDPHYQWLLFKENEEHLRDYYPSSREKQLMRHIVYSDTVRVLFSLF
jgi:hypothetical protein